MPVATVNDVQRSRRVLLYGVTGSGKRWLSLGRLLRRTLIRTFDRRPICNSNVETPRQLFSQDSIIVWHFRSFARKRSAMRAWASRAEGPPVLLVQRPNQLDQLLSVLGGDTPTSSR